MESICKRPWTRTDLIKNVSISTNVSIGLSLYSLWPSKVQARRRHINSYENHGLSIFVDYLLLRRVVKTFKWRLMCPCFLSTPNMMSQSLHETRTPSKSVKWIFPILSVFFYTINRPLRSRLKTSCSTYLFVSPPCGTLFVPYDRLFCVKTWTLPKWYGPCKYGYSFSNLYFRPWFLSYTVFVVPFFNLK